MDFNILGRRNPLKSRTKPTESKASAEESSVRKDESASLETSIQSKPKSKLFQPHTHSTTETISSDARFFSL